MLENTIGGELMNDHFFIHTHHFVVCISLKAGECDPFSPLVCFDGVVLNFVLTSTGVERANDRVGKGLGEGEGKRGRETRKRDQGEIRY